MWAAYVILHVLVATLKVLNMLIFKYCIYTKIYKIYKHFNM